jgi:hypothetical protein
MGLKFCFALYLTSALLISSAGAAVELATAKNEQLLEARLRLKIRLGAIQTLRQLHTPTPPIAREKFKHFLLQHQPDILNFIDSTQDLNYRDSHKCGLFAQVTRDLQKEFLKSLNSSYLKNGSLPDQARLKTLFYLISTTESLMESGEEGGSTLLSGTKSVCIDPTKRLPWLHGYQNIVRVERELTGALLGIPDLAHTEQLSLSLSWMLADRAESEFRWAAPKIIGETVLSVALWELVVVRVAVGAVEVGLVSARTAGLAKSAIIGSYGAYQGASFATDWSKGHLRPMVASEIQQLLIVALNYARSKANNLSGTDQLLSAFEHGEALRRSATLKDLKHSLEVIRSKWGTLEEAMVRNQIELQQIQDELGGRGLSQN